VSTGDALDQVIRQLEAERSRVVPRTRPTVTAGDGKVAWPPAGVEPRTAEQQAEARRVLAAETEAFDAERRGQSRGRRLRAVS
jgi:hypothetical protein